MRWHVHDIDWFILRLHQSTKLTSQQQMMDTARRQMTRDFSQQQPEAIIRLLNPTIYSVNLQYISNYSKPFSQTHCSSDLSKSNSSTGFWHTSHDVKWAKCWTDCKCIKKSKTGDHKPIAACLSSQLTWFVDEQQSKQAQVITSRHQTYYIILLILTRIKRKKTSATWQLIPVVACVGLYSLWLVGQ
jgi:hypothetical protein